MQAPTSQSLLAAWELGNAEPHLIERGLALLAAAYSDTPRADLVRLSIGERDSLLLALREQAFGPRLTALADCQNCGERLEFQLRAADLALPRDHRAHEPLLLSFENYEVEFRLPNSFDLYAVREAGDLSHIRQALVDRLVSRALLHSQQIEVRKLPEAVIAAMDEKMSLADPQAEVELDLHCEVCGHQWRMVFDIVSFLWIEVEAWAIRLLRDVHSLARAYAWREADILAMSPWRRQCYLEMLGG